MALAASIMLDTSKHFNATLAPLKVEGGRTRAVEEPGSGERPAPAPKPVADTTAVRARPAKRTPPPSPLVSTVATPKPVDPQVLASRRLARAATGDAQRRERDAREAARQEALEIQKLRTMLKAMELQLKIKNQSVPAQ
jgi:hypothetical protein